MRVLIPGGGTPFGFGIGYSEDRDEMHILSQCCSSEVVYLEKVDNIGCSGHPDAGGTVECLKCQQHWSGYSDHWRSSPRSSAMWVEIWTGLKDVTVDVEE